VEAEMPDVSKLRLLCSSFCRHYRTEAKFYIDTTSGSRNLVVIYEKGGYGGLPEFVAGIPNSWTSDNVIDPILTDGAETKYPAWEMRARMLGSPMLGPSD
jgi:hypothetical protein